MYPTSCSDTVTPCFAQAKNLKKQKQKKKHPTTVHKNSLCIMCVLVVLMLLGLVLRRRT